MHEVLRITLVVSRRTLALALLCTLLGAAAPLSAAPIQTVLYSFNKGAHGQFPNGGLVLDAKGNLFGTTSEGGLLQHNCGSSGCGTVFKVTQAGAESVLYSFTGTSGDGEIPASGLMLDANGNLYGNNYVDKSHGNS